MTDKPIKVSELKAEAARLIAAGEMPTLEEFLDAVAKVRKAYKAKLREHWRNELDADLKAKTKKR